MSIPASPKKRVGLFLPPGGGRSYPMGRISAVFKADGDETHAGYSISEWWLEAHTQGPGAHSHEEDDIFYVIEGTMAFLLMIAGSKPPRAPLCWRPEDSLMISRTEALPERVC